MRYPAQVGLFFATASLPGWRYWQAEPAAPVSYTHLDVYKRQDFDDVYFSNDNGLEETRYVFLGGNHLEARFPEHPHPLFVVAASGFGTGLNFLTVSYTHLDVYKRQNQDRSRFQAADQFFIRQMQRFVRTIFKEWRMESQNIRMLD